MITIGGKEWISSADEIYYGNRKIQEVYYGNKKVYPDNNKILYFKDFDTCIYHIMPTYYYYYCEVKEVEQKLLYKRIGLEKPPTVIDTRLVIRYSDTNIDSLYKTIESDPLNRLSTDKKYKLVSGNVYGRACIFQEDIFNYINNIVYVSQGPYVGHSPDRRTVDLYVSLKDGKIYEDYFSHDEYYYNWPWPIIKKQIRFLADGEKITAYTYELTSLDSYNPSIALKDDLNRRAYIYNYLTIDTSDMFTFNGNYISGKINAKHISDYKYGVHDPEAYSKLINYLFS